MITGSRDLALAVVRPLAWCALVLALIWPGAGAFAHASLVTSEPADGAVLRVAPSIVTLHFNEPVSPIVVSLVDAGGIRHSDLAVSPRGEILEIGLPSDLPVGTQTLSYRIISADGHPVGGVVAFSIGMPGGAAPAATEDVWRATAILAVRWAIYIALFVGVGGAFFVHWIAVDPLGAQFERGLTLLLAAGAVAVAMSVGMQGLDMLGADWSGFFTVATWIAGAGGSFGAAAGVVLAAFCLATASLVTRGVEASKALSILAVVMVGVALATTGHASAASPQWLTRPAVFVHAVGVTIWVGALLPLFSQARTGTASLAKTLGRFSRLALWTVPLLIAAGLLLAEIQVVEPRALLATTYGEILSAKLVAVALLLALAVVNWRFLTPRVAGGAPAGRRWIARSIAGEIILSVAILGLVAGWRFTPPPRALLQRVPAAPEMLHIHGAKMMVTLTFSPGRVGENRLHIDLLNGDFGPLDPKEVTISLAPADKSIEPRIYSARPEGDGGYNVDRVFVPVSGKWAIEVSALIDDFTKSELSGEREFAN